MHPFPRLLALFSNETAVTQDSAGIFLVSRVFPSENAVVTMGRRAVMGEEGADTRRLFLLWHSRCNSEDVSPLLGKCGE